MIGLKEAATLVASAVLFLSSVFVPVGDPGAVALKSLDDGGTHALASNPAPIDAGSIELYELVVSGGTPIPPATIDEPVPRLTGIVAPAQGTQRLDFGGERLTVPGGARVTIENATGPIDLDPAGLATEVTLSGSATDVEVHPPENPAVSTHAGGRESVPATNVTLGGRALDPGFRDAGSFDEISFAVPPDATGDPHLLVDQDTTPLEPRVGVQVEDLVGVLAVVDADGDDVRVHVEGYARVTVGERTYEVTVDETVGTDKPPQGPLNEAPTANFTYRPTTPHAGETVHFVDESDDDLVLRDWHWSFDDGSTSREQNPQHRFPGAGFYDVTLTVTDVGGKESSTTRTVVVENTPPRVELDWTPLIPEQTETVSFDAEVEDPDSDVVSVEWAFSDGRTLQGREIQRSFLEEGDHQVNVTATDTQGNEGTASATIHVDNAPPVANFTVDPEHPLAGEPATLRSTSHDVADGSIVDHAWEAPGGQTASGENATVEFPSDGPASVELTVTDDDGAETTVQRTVDVLNPPPEVDVELHPVYPNPGEEVDFVADVTDDDRAESAEWTFSDGQTRQGLSVPRTFDAGGTYTATVEVRDADGANGTAERTFDVNHLPSLTVEIPGEGLDPGETALLTGEELAVEASTADPDGNETEVQWTVDGNRLATTPACEATDVTNGSNLSCTWPDDGRHLVEVTARDENGGTVEHKLSVLVLNRKPDVSPEVLGQAVEVGEQATFAANAEDPDGVVTSVRWIVDGETVGEGPLLNYTFTDGGSHRVEANATDDDGASEQAGVDVDVDAPPTVSLDVSTRSPAADEEVTFSADAQDPDGPDGDLHYGWTFGDGDQADGATVTHTYAREGTYQAQLTVTDVDGSQTNRSVTLDVTAPPIAGELDLSPAEPQAGEAVQLTVDLDGGRTIESAEWSFGDGNGTTTSDATVTHTYERPRTVTAVATVETADGASGSIAETVRVTGAMPHAFRITPHLPDGNCPNVTSPAFGFELVNSRTGARIALPGSGASVTWDRPGGSGSCTLEASFPAGTWSIGDGFRVVGSVDGVDTRELDDFSLSAEYVDPDFLLERAPLSFHDPHVAPRESDPFVGDGSEDQTTYHDPTEPVHVRSVLRWDEGTPVENYNVQLAATYGGPQTVQVGSGVEYRDVTVSTDAQGRLDARVPAPVAGALADGDDPDEGSFVYPPGRYAVRLTAASQLEIDSARVTFVEDPAGIFEVLGDVEIGGEPPES